MSEINLDQTKAILSRWQRQDYITRVRPSISGTPTLDIPMALREDMAIEPGAEVEWKLLEDGTINIKIEPPTKYKLEDLVAGITDENRHQYIDTGAPVGQEVW
jgi:antitoxin MazE